ncbi:MAG: hypothetical protein R3F43_05500 [bacterium]
MGLPRFGFFSRLGIWGFALGYFLAYVPYSALTKALSGGHLGGEPVSGFELLPVSALASLVAMFVTITVLGWWKHSSRLAIGGVSIPFPGRWTFLSGLCTAAIIATTTLAYTFEGVSIVFMMLLMRGGLLVLAPLVDKVTGRRVRWFSWAALAMSMGALLVAFSSDSGFALTLTAIVDVVVYLLSYFVRLRFMSKIAKSDDPVVRARYFVEEQMVATPAMVAVLVVLAFLDHGQFSHDIRAGFTSFFQRPVVFEGVLWGSSPRARASSGAHPAGWPGEQLLHPGEPRVEHPGRGGRLVRPGGPRPRRPRRQPALRGGPDRGGHRLLVAAAAAGAPPGAPGPLIRAGRRVPVEAGFG